MGQYRGPNALTKGSENNLIIIIFKGQNGPQKASFTAYVQDIRVHNNYSVNMIVFVSGYRAVRVT